MSKLSPSLPKMPLPFLFLLLIFSPFQGNSQSLNAQRTTLLSLKQRLGNPPSIQPWNSSSLPCDWPEIRCTNGTVTGILLGDKNITEKIPATICDFENLTELDLAFNYIPGGFPEVLFNCSKLEKLNLSQNYFVGSIPAEIYRLSSLQDLDLSVNNFSGDIPATLGRLSKLKTLNLHENEFTGTFPPAIGNLTNLEVLGMAYNKKFGPATIPKEFGNLKKLRYLRFTASNLVGEIPEGIENCSSLEQLDLSTNSLGGTIPKGLLSLKNLTKLYLFRNSLSGEIPASVQSLNLIHIDLAMNHLIGSIPKNFGKLQNLELLNLFSNQLWGEIPASIGLIPSLKKVRLFRNNLSGILPQKIGLQSKLETFEVSENQLSGQIPFEIANWEGLIVFKASNNMFSGEIPGELTSLQLLDTLLLDGNQLSGELPSEMRWKSLRTLNLSRNNLCGQIPAAIGSLPNLLHLDLSENQFSGKIPSEIGNLSFDSLNLSFNRLSGKIPYRLENLTYENSFLNNSNLCADKAILNLPSCPANHHSSGKLSPGNLAMILGLVMLVLLVTLLLTTFMIGNYQRKRRAGRVEKWILMPFHRLNFTESTDILMGWRKNLLIGDNAFGNVFHVTVGDSGESFAVKRIRNNRKLDDKLEGKFMAEVQKLGKIQHSNIVKLLCCISSEDTKLLVYEYMKNQSLDVWLHKSGALSSTGLDHQVVLDWPRRLRIAVGAAKGLCYMHHDYSSAPIIHGNVKSSNILLDSEFKATIGDFGLATMLPNHEEPDTTSANARTFGYYIRRMLSATGKLCRADWCVSAVSCTNMCDSPRVHDTHQSAHQPRAVVADRTMPHHIINLGCADTRKVEDVYSFGVVLLELVTGREPNNESEDMCLAEWALQFVEEGKSIVDALDEKIKEPCHLAEMRKVFELGLKCTSNVPSTRPSMKEVLGFLDNLIPRPLARSLTI